VLLSQDEARFARVPSLGTTLAIQGFRPLVGTWDNQDLVYGFAALTLVSGPLTTRLLDSPARAKTRRWKYSRPVGRPWWADETYIKVKGRGVYLYRAVDKAGQTVDFYLSEHRDEGRQVLLSSDERTLWNPDEVTLDGFKPRIKRCRS
jgi:hypothetical protein